MHPLRKVFTMLPASAFGPVSILPQYYNNEFYFFVATLKTLQNNISTNFVASPLSVETFVKLFQLLCSDECAEEIRKGLFHLELHREKIKSDVQDLLFAIHGECRNLKVVSFMFYHNEYEIRDDFDLTIDGFFRANKESCDMTKPEKAAEFINRTISAISQNSITRAIEPYNFSEDTKVILISTLYLQAQWYQPFDEVPIKCKFFKAKDEVIMTDVLQKICPRRYCRSEELKADLVEIKFVEDGAMVIVLPDDIKGISGLEEKLKKVFEIRAFSFQERILKIVLPVFRIFTHIDYTNIVQECGIKKIFNKNEADFSRFLGHKSDFHIKSILQKVRLEITRDGVTTNDRRPARNTDCPVYPVLNHRFYKLVNVNHPFIFYIRIKDAIIFVGRVMDPTWTGPVE